MKLSFGLGLPRCCSHWPENLALPLSLSLSQLVRASLSLNLSLARCICVCICISICACLYLFVLPLLDLPLTLALPLFRSVSAAERCLSPIGRPGLRRADTTLAVSAGAARWFVERQLYKLGGPIRWVPAHRPGRGGKAMGRAQGQAEYELRQAEQSSTVSTRSLPPFPTSLLQLNWFP